MMVDGPLREEEPLRDLGVAEPFGDEPSTSSSRAVRPAGFPRVEGRGPRGTPRTPRSRSRRATSAAAGPAPSAPSSARAPSKRLGLVGVAQGERGLVGAAERSQRAAAASQSPERWTAKGSAAPSGLGSSMPAAGATAPARPRSTRRRSRPRPRASRLRLGGRVGPARERRGLRAGDRDRREMLKVALSARDREGLVEQRDRPDRPGACGRPPGCQRSDSQERVAVRLTRGRRTRPRRPRPSVPDRVGPCPVHDQVEPPQLEPVLGAVLDPSVEPLDRARSRGAVRRPRRGGCSPGRRGPRAAPARRARCCARGRRVPRDVPGAAPWCRCC